MGADSGLNLDLQNTEAGAQHLLPGAVNLTLRLSAANLPGIEQSAYLRLYLLPITQWSLPIGSCASLCAASPGYDCGTPDCVVEQLLPMVFRSYLERYVVLRVQLPATMDTAVGNIVHTLSVLSLPTLATSVISRHL